MKKPGEQNDSPDEEKTSPVSIFAEMLVNLITFKKFVKFILLLKKGTRRHENF